MLTAQFDHPSVAPVRLYGLILPPPFWLPPPFCASSGPGQRRCASSLHNVLSWVVYEEYFYSTAPFPEKRGIHHKVSLTLGDGAGLGEGARVQCLDTRTTASGRGRW